MEEFLEQINQELPPCEAKDTLHTLAKVLGNIARKPDESKYRTLKKDNRLVAEHICGSMAAVSLLLTVGFEDHGDMLVCPMCTDLEQIKAASERLQHSTMDLDVLASAGHALQEAATSSLQPAPLVDLGGDLLGDPLEAAAAGGATGTPAGASRAAAGDLLSGEPLDFLSGDPADNDDLLSLTSGATATGVVEGATSTGAQPGRAEDAKKPPPRAFRRRTDEEKQRSQTAERLEELRRAQREKFTEAARGGRGPDRPPGGPTTGRGPEPPLSADLLDIAPAAAATDAGGDASQEQATERKKDLRAFQRRKEDPREEAAQSLEEIKRLQRERYAQFRSDPGAQASEAYARPPTGSCRPGGGRQQSTSSSASSAPKVPGTEAAPGGGGGGADWLSDASQGLSQTSERIQSGLTDMSRQLSEQLSAAGLGSWFEPSGRPAAGAAPAQPAPPPGDLPHRFLVVGRAGALVRERVELSSGEVYKIPEGTTFIALESTRTAEGTWRLRIEDPVRGWLSFKTDIVKRITSS